MSSLSKIPTSCDLATNVAPLRTNIHDEDSLTVLLCSPHNVATKTHRKIDGLWQTEQFNAGWQFTCMTLPVANLGQLACYLMELEKNPRMFLIRGLPLPHVKRDQPHHRRKHGEEATYASPEDGHYYFMLDIDKLPLPDGMTLTPATVNEAIEHVIQVLPSEFADASYYWQLSASAGLRDNTCISAHLFFWSDRKLRDDDLKRWGKHVNQQEELKLIDCALFNDVQPHFIASPIFETGDDPFPVRSGFVGKRWDSVRMVIPEIAEQPSVTSALGVTAASGHGFDHFLGQIGDHPGGDGFNGPIIRAIASYVASVGADRVDRGWLRDTVRTAILSADASQHDQHYVEMKAGDNFLNKAIDGAIRKYGHTKRTRLTPGQKPHHQTTRMSANDAVKKLRSIIRRFFR